MAPVVSASKNWKQLPSDYVPGKYSVLCGRGKACSRSTGNRRLKSLVDSNLKPYSGALNKIQKTKIVSTIMALVKEAAPEGPFVKRETNGVWWEVDDAFAREKIGCMFRDTLHTKYRSSTKAKKARKNARNSASTALLETTSQPSNSSSSSSSSSLHNGYTTSLAEQIFGPDTNADIPPTPGHNTSSCEVPMQIQSYHHHEQPAVSKNKKNNWDDYSSLLSSYLDYQLDTRSSRHPPGDTFPFPTSRMEGGRKEALSATVQQACDLLENDCMSDSIVSEMLFEDDALPSVLMR